jgi:hypothetical protein
LIASNNRIESIDGNNFIKNIPNLISVTLSYNNISSLSVVQTIGQSCKLLQFLDLTGNSVTSKYPTYVSARGQKEILFYWMFAQKFISSCSTFCPMKMIFFLNYSMCSFSLFLADDCICHDEWHVFDAALFILMRTLLTNIVILFCFN